MITIFITSRLGNQLFQYAFGFATARKLKTFFIVDSSRAKHGYIIPEYFELNKWDIYQFLLRRYYSRSHHKRKFKKGEINIITQTGFDHPKEILDVISDDTLYLGYYQSIDYFIDCQKSIRKIFKIKRQYVSEFNEKYAALFKEKKTIVVHIRRTDYISYGKEVLGGKNMCLPDSYFTDCLNEIANIESYSIIFISDDISYTKNKYSSVYPTAKFESNSSIIDLQLLINADLLIISNSTFAWWGAYLNTKPLKKVYAPKYWLGFKVKEEYPVGILIPSWTTMEVKFETPHNLKAI